MKYGSGLIDLTINTGTQVPDNNIPTESWDEITFYVPTISTYTAVASTDITLQTSVAISGTYYDVITDTGSGVTVNTVNTAGDCWINFPQAGAMPYVRIKLGDATTSDMPIKVMLTRTR